ncbi:hypothetical protein RRG08_053272 [Elysia crispata]|uniref:Uncharacterized protein n=1 Tax=Elysia crispata TaxID=231223 RepID=A0AAE1E1K6_9GAST|nr:hypothetical protein RRG08_053272 [Elysia crispata]
MDNQILPTSVSQRDRTLGDGQSAEVREKGGSEIDGLRMQEVRTSCRQGAITSTASGRLLCVRALTQPDTG